MKKKILQISILMLILFTMSLVFTINQSQADSIAGINCPSTVNVNENFNVSLILPSNAYSAEANVTAKFSDGSTSTGRIVYMQGMSDFPNAVTLNAKKEGSATITISNIIISDSSSNALENGGSKSQGFNVANPGASAPATQTPATQTPTTSAKYTDVTETVYTTERCNIRESDSTSSNKIATVDKATKLTRKGVGENGWSKVEYNGKTCYVSSQYLTKDTPPDPEFKTVNETMYAKQSCNLRASWSIESDKVGYLDEGQEVTRIGIGENGWSKIKYNGSEVYIATRLLQAEPLEEKPEETEEPEEEPEAVNNDHAEELAEIKKEVGVLPEVGNNIAVYIYSCLAIIALIGAGYGIYYTNKK